MQSVYLETTVIGNIAGRIHPDPLIAARQTITRQWWATAATRYHLIDAVCRGIGHEPATICTPEQLLEVYDDS